MTKRLPVVLASAMFLTVVALPQARAGVRRETPERRPYITEIGEPYSISRATLQDEAAKISEMRDYFARYGYPDYAEVQEIAPEWPWESYEVRLYYMHWNLEVDFGHLLFSDAIADLGVRKYQGEIPPEKRRQIEVILEARVAAPPPPPAAAEPAEGAATREEPATSGIEEPATGGISEAVVARLEAAAERAARAADLAAEQSEAAVRAADRTVAIVEKIEAQERQ